MQSIWGEPPNTDLSVAVGGLEATRNLTASACGVATIRPSLSRPIPATFKIGAKTINTANLPTQLLPKCLPSGQLEEARTADFKTAEGAVVIVGQAPSAAIVMSFADTKERKVKMNACGWGKISNPTANPFTGATSFRPFGATSTTMYSHDSNPKHLDLQRRHRLQANELELCGRTF